MTLLAAIVLASWALTIQSAWRARHTGASHPTYTITAVLSSLALALATLL